MGMVITQHHKTLSGVGIGASTVLLCAGPSPTWEVWEEVGGGVVEEEVEEEVARMAAWPAFVGTAHKAVFEKPWQRVRFGSGPGPTKFLSTSCPLLLVGVAFLRNKTMLRTDLHTWNFGPDGDGPD